MQNIWSILVPVFIMVIGVLSIIKRDKSSEEQIENAEKYMLDGRPASKVAVSVSRYSILVGGIFFTLLGIALLINNLLKP